MFSHELIETYGLDEVPLGEHIFLMDEEWMSDYEKALLEGLAGGEWDYSVGYISDAVARHVTPEGLELSWYPNRLTRFHEMRVNLPRPAFLTCVGCAAYGEKPRIFVKSDWLLDIHLRTNSAFAMVDAIGVKEALAAGRITASLLDVLRNRIDDVASRHTDIAFVSFADSLLLKTNWSVGCVGSSVTYTYNPERIIRVLPEIAQCFLDVLGLHIYSVVTQGRNEFYRDELLHVSSAGNHLSLNSLGVPFAQLQAIENAARAAIRNKVHSPCGLYVDSQFFYSLKFRLKYERHREAAFPYDAPMTGFPCKYVACRLDSVLDNLDEMGGS